MPEIPFIPYPPIARHGLVSDRRTAALVAADGTVDWCCLPNFDGPPVFAALLDAEKGGYCRLGPPERDFGRQDYVGDTFGLRTRWENGLELTDLMLWPADHRAPHDVDRRVLVRRLRSGGAPCPYQLDVAPRFEQGRAPAFHPLPPGGFWDGAAGQLGLWSSVAVREADGVISANGVLEAGEEAWLALSFGDGDEGWSLEHLRAAFENAMSYWRDWTSRLDGSTLTPEVTRAALLAHALTFAPTGAVIAAPTAALPERIGGSRNFDYRFSWIRDGSLTMAFLTRVGRADEAERFVDWVAGLSADGPMPLQVCYRIDGGTKVHPAKKQPLHGYRGSQPVQFGNPADTLYEIDSFGYLADCVLIHVENGGRLSDRSWDLIVRIADFVVENWSKPGASIWELSPPQEFVVSRVLSWVTLDRAVRLAQATGRSGSVEWTLNRDEIHGQVCEKGFDAGLNSFRQRYDSEAVDAGLLLIPLMNFLPVDDPRVIGTVHRVVSELAINGHVHRFVPREISNQGDDPLGQEEGSFLLCTCWLAQLQARQGRVAEAKASLARVTAAASETGLLSEEVDARSGEQLGNMPLLFTHVEYVRAIWAIAEAEGRQTRA